MRILLLTSLLLATSARAQSPHEEALRAHEHVAPTTFPPPFRFLDEEAPRVNRIVYGYYPYWVSQWDQIRWDLLTHIAYFAIEMEPTGHFGSTHGWPDQNFVDTAHSHGVRVDITFTLFSGAGFLELCQNSQNRDRAIINMVDAMEAGGADGINVDFESLSDRSGDCFTTFIRLLREKMTERGFPDAQIGIAGPAVDWHGNFQLGELAELIDVYFIMGYGYHWTRSGKAGPIGQLRVTESWRPHVTISMQKTIAHYTALVSALRRDRIVFGVPYYGREWPTASDEIHASTTGDGSARTYAVARRALANGRARRYDNESQNPWYAYSSGGWRQCWYDDEESLAAKYQLALEQNIGGIGMWALGYDEDYPELWDTLEAYFTAEPDVLDGTRAQPIPIASTPWSTQSDTRHGPSNYFNAYSCSPDKPEYGREWVYEFSTCRAGEIAISVADGAGVDIDIHLLDGPEEVDCLARNDSSIIETINAGHYYIVADSFVSSSVPQEGAFDLEVSFTADPSDPGCAADEECRQGRCVGVPDPATAIQSVDPALVRVPNQADPEKEPPVSTEEDGGCACRTDASPARPILHFFRR